MPKVSLADALERLPAKFERPFDVIVEEPEFSIEIFAPRDIDRQTPHTRDEIYVVARGKSDFNEGGEMYAVVAGDVIVVAAGLEHRFENMSADFATWVIFVGRES